MKQTIKLNCGLRCKHCHRVSKRGNLVVDQNGNWLSFCYGKRTGYYCTQFYKNELQEPINSGKYEDVCTAVQTIYQKNLNWSVVRAGLPEPKKEVCGKKGGRAYE